MPRPEMDGEHGHIGRVEIVEGNKVGARGLDPVPGFGGKSAFVGEVGLAVELVLACADKRYNDFDRIRLFSGESQRFPYNAYFCH